MADASRALAGRVRGRLRGQRHPVPVDPIRRRRPARDRDDRSANARFRRTAQPGRGVFAAPGSAAGDRVHRGALARTGAGQPASTQRGRLMLELDAITIATPERVLIRRLSAQVAGSEVLTVMGESGSGKSSLLAMICGTLPDGLIASGSIRLAGRDLGELSTSRRRVGMLFQDDLLFLHMTVLDNLLFALPADDSRAKRVAAAQAALQSAGLEGHALRFPASLSGGQRARVSVLRALLAQPDALLLDEPFSKLDAALRQRFRSFVFERIAQQRIPAVLVTHDPQDVPEGGSVIELQTEPEDA